MYEYMYEYILASCPMSVRMEQKFDTCLGMRMKITFFFQKMSIDSDVKKIVGICG